MKNNLYDLWIELNLLTVFRGILRDDVISALMDILSFGENSSERDKVYAYSEFVSRLYNKGTDNISDYVCGIVNDDENIYVKYVGAKKTVPENIASSLSAELKCLQKVADLTPERLRENLSYDGFMPGWKNKNIDIASDYMSRVEDIDKYGYGIYARYRMFYIDAIGKIVPVLSPDPVLLSDLADYHREKKLIMDNTVALLQGKPAANILLTGDAGTGKSSTVKAVVNELYGEGLRIIEMRKEQLRELPAILDELSNNPLKFVLFIDDLSFTKDDDDFSALKAMLEGSVSAKSKNVIIYATSNRRHLVKEKFSDREGDDIHFNDTVQEIISLSDRFGLQITFNRPDKDTYLDIVRALAKANNLEYSPEIMDVEAERFALMRGTRSARAAKQYVDSLLTKN